MLSTNLMPTQVKQVRHNGTGSQARQSFKVRFQKPVTILQLTATTLGITTNQSRHKLGLSNPARPHQEIPLSFFSLLTTFSVEHPTHNREVCL
jgi:hypothetical protein